MVETFGGNKIVDNTYFRVSISIGNRPYKPNPGKSKCLKKQNGV